MAQGNEEATFKLNMGGDAADVAKTTAKAMEDLRSQIAAGNNALKEMRASMKNLKGSTDEIKKAKANLKAQIDAQKLTIKGTNAELKKQREAYSLSGAETRKLKASTKELADKMKELAERRKKTAEATFAQKLKDDQESLSMLNAVALGAVAALAALAVGFIAAGVAAAKFVLRGADAARSIGLLREAAMNGNAQWGKNFGEQVDALARKVPTSKAQIDELGKSLALSRIGGQVWVDTLNAVTQASAALGDGAGGKLKEFVTRGREFGRFQINPQEMIGTGIDFKDVAEALAKSMHVGVKDAQQALFEGRVKLADGAAALRAAVEKKVGGVNLRQMLSFDNLLKKMGESFDELTKGIDLEPMLKGFKEIANIFSITTTSGQALKQIVEVFGKELTGAFVGTTPLAKKFVYGMIIGAQELVIAYLQVRNHLRKTFGDSELLKNVDTLKLALTAGRYAAYGIAAAMVIVAAGVALAVAPFVALYGAVTAFQTAGEKMGEWFRKTDWAATGSMIVDGLVNGLKLGASKLYGAVKALAVGTKDTFKQVLQISSPAKAMIPVGKEIPAGVEVGVDQGASSLNRKVGSMVDIPTGGNARAGGGGGAPITVNVTINASGGDAKEIAAKVSSASVLEDLTKAVLNALQGGGVPVPS